MQFRIGKAVIRYGLHPICDFQPIKIRHIKDTCYGTDCIGLYFCLILQIPYFTLSEGFRTDKRYILSDGQPVYRIFNHSITPGTEKSHLSDILPVNDILLHLQVCIGKQIIRNPVHGFHKGKLTYLCVIEQGCGCAVYVSKFRLRTVVIQLLNLRLRKGKTVNASDIFCQRQCFKRSIVKSIFAN